MNLISDTIGKLFRFTVTLRNILMFNLFITTQVNSNWKKAIFNMKNDEKSFNWSFVIKVISYLK